MKANTPPAPLCPPPHTHWYTQEHAQTPQTCTTYVCVHTRLRMWHVSGFEQNMRLNSQEDKEKLRKESEKEKLIRPQTS